MSSRRRARKGVLGAVVETVKLLIENRAVQMSGALAYFSALSLAPLMIITLGVTGLIVDRQSAQEHVAATVGELVGPRGAELIRTLGTEQERSGAGGWSAALGVVMLLFGASAVFAQLQDGLNAIWGVGQRHRSGLWMFLRTRLISMAMVFCLGFLLLVSMLANTLLAALGQRIASLVGERAVIALPLHYLAMLAFTGGIFAVLFKVLPDARVGWREAWTGALVTALLFQLGAWGIGLYVGRAGVGSAYGAAGSIVVLLVWVFYASLIVFTGAQFARVRAPGADVPTRVDGGADGSTEVRGDRASAIGAALAQDRDGNGAGKPSMARDRR